MSGAGLTLRWSIVHWCSSHLHANDSFLSHIGPCCLKLSRVMMLCGFLVQFSTPWLFGVIISNKRG